MAHYITDASGKLMKVSGNGYSNLDCLKTEVIYDMTSNDASKNWGYASGIRGNVEITGKDFTKYKQLKFYGLRAGIMVFCAEIDISQPAKQSSSLFGRATSCFHFVSGGTSYVAGMTVEVNPTLTGFTIKFTQNTSDQAGNTDWVVAKIEGVLHEPSMIYTGAELYAGNGISIKDGVISTSTSEASQFLLYGTAGATSGATSGTITLGDITPYKFLVFVSGHGGYKTINTYSVKSFVNGALGLYGYASQYINITISGSPTACKFTIDAVGTQSLWTIWGVK